MQFFREPSCYTVKYPFWQRLWSLQFQKSGGLLTKRKKWGDCRHSLSSETTLWFKWNLMWDKSVDKVNLTESELSDYTTNAFTSEKVKRILSSAGGFVNAFFSQFTQIAIVGCRYTYRFHNYNIFSQFKMINCRHNDVTSWSYHFASVVAFNDWNDYVFLFSFVRERG